MAVRSLEAQQRDLLDGTAWQSADEQVEQVVICGGQLGFSLSGLAEKRTGSASLPLPRLLQQDMDEHALRPSLRIPPG